MLFQVWTVYTEHDHKGKLVKVEMYGEKLVRPDLAKHNTLKLSTGRVMTWRSFRSHMRARDYYDKLNDKLTGNY